MNGLFGAKNPETASVYPKYFITNKLKRKINRMSKKSFRLQNLLL